MKFAWLPLVAACGGAPFSLMETDAGPPDVLQTVDSPADVPTFRDGGQDAAPDRLTVGRPDVEAEMASAEAALPDAGPPEATPDVGRDVAPEATSAPEAGPPSEAAPDVCATPAPFVFSCGTNRASVNAPSQYCVDTNAGTSYQGQAMMVPTACACDYSCACLLAHVAMPCVGRVYVGCSDPTANSGVSVGCQ